MFVCLGCCFVARCNLRFRVAAVDRCRYCHIDISRMHDVFVDDKRPTQSIKAPPHRHACSFALRSTGFRLHIVCSKLRSRADAVDLRLRQRSLCADLGARGIPLKCAARDQAHIPLVLAAARRRVAHVCAQSSVGVAFPKPNDIPCACADRSIGRQVYSATSRQQCANTAVANRMCAQCTLHRYSRECHML